MAGMICVECETEMNVLDGYWVCVNGHRFKVKREEIPVWAEE